MQIIAVMYEYQDGNGRVHSIDREYWVHTLKEDLPHSFG